MTFRSFFFDLNTVVPSHDFIHHNFDEKNQKNLEVKILYLLVSTPRSGSTWLCSEIHRKYGLVVHEYLQTAQYIPLFAKRNGLLQQDINNEEWLDFDKYVNTLILLRSKQGILGVNVHINHLFLAEELCKSIEYKYPNVKIIVHYLKRNDKALQAISYAKAHYRGIWSQVNDSNTITAGKNNYKSFYEKALQICFILIDAAMRYKALISQEKRYLSDLKKIPFTRTFIYEHLSNHPSALYSSIELIAFDLNLTAKVSKNQGIKLIKTSSRVDTKLTFIVKLLALAPLFLTLNLLLSRAFKKLMKYRLSPRKKQSLLNISFSQYNA